jgi:integrase
LHLNPTIGAKRLARLSPQDIHGLYKEKLTCGLSRGRVRKIHVTLNRVLKDAVRWRYTSRNPAAEVTPPQEYQREIDVLAVQQVKQLLSAARDDRLEAAYVLPATVGPRQGECLALRYEDIDFDKGMLAVQRTVWRNNVICAEDTAQPAHHKTPACSAGRFEEAQGQQRWRYRGLAVPHEAW